MIDMETFARIRRLFFAEHWKVGTIATELGLHNETVERALNLDRLVAKPIERPSMLDAYQDFICSVLKEHPKLTATRIFRMVQVRGYGGSLVHLRRFVRKLRPQYSEPFLRRTVFPGEESQVDWAHFGKVPVVSGSRTLSLFVMTLSYSRALYLEFFFDQSMENFLRGHVNAFAFFGGVPRICLYDNLRSVVLERRGQAVHFHPRLIELSAHYHFQARPCAPARGNEKGRVERAIRYIRDSFFAGRTFITREALNRAALDWRDQVAHVRPWVQDREKTVHAAFVEEQSRLIQLPGHAFETDQIIPVTTKKQIWVRFDGNDYSIPPEGVGKRLTLVASGTKVRIMDGDTERACHHRSYDCHQTISNSDHIQALLKTKQKARESVRSQHLITGVPESEAFLDAAFERGESAALQTSQLLKLMDEYGSDYLRTATKEALDRGTPRASSVRFLIEKRRRKEKETHPLPVDLSSRPKLAEFHVNPHDPEAYDELSSKR